MKFLWIIIRLILIMVNIPTHFQLLFIHILLTEMVMISGNNVIIFNRYSIYSNKGKQAFEVTKCDHLWRGVKRLPAASYSFPKKGYREHMRNYYFLVMHNKNQD